MESIPPPSSPLSSSTPSLHPFRFLIVIMVTVSMVTAPAEGFPKGAPQYVCGNMRPLHPGREQTYDPETFPYSIDVSGGTDVLPGSLVTVTVRTKRPDEVLKGLLVTTVDSSDHSVTGLSAPQGAPLQMLNCTLQKSKVSVADSGLTHTQRLDSDSVTFFWRVPGHATLGEFYRIRLTVVKTVYVYWVGINTTLTITHPTPHTVRTHAPETTSPSTGTTSRLPTSNGGGSSRFSGSFLRQARPWYILVNPRFRYPSYSRAVMGARNSFGRGRTNKYVDLRARWAPRFGGRGNSWNSGGGMASWVSAWFGR